MTITLPSIEVVFKQLAGTLIDRSKRGIAILIIKDSTNVTFNYKEYTSVTAAIKEKALYTTTNLQYIKDIFNFALDKVAVVRIDATNSNLSDALAIIERNIKTGWITVAGGTADDFTTLASWIKTKEGEGKTYKAVTYKATAPDCKHVVNFFNEKVTFTDARGNVTGEKYCPSLVGILASCNVERGSTYFECSNLKNVEEVVDKSTAVDNGKFILINDVNKVKVALGINSMTTVDGETATEDMKFIDTVEAMDIIEDDIRKVYLNDYSGKNKNKYDNQVLFISAINTYFKELEDESILDEEYNNEVDVDVEAQREAWLAVGKEEAATWTDIEVKNNAFKRTAFICGDIKILGCMENLKLNITLF